MARRGHADECPRAPAGKIDEEHCQRNVGNGKSSARCVRRWNGEGGRANEANANGPLPAADRRQAAFDQVVRDVAAADHAERTQNIRNRH